MFKKLKDKIAEEVKSSPQRIQQLTQSVSEKIQNATSDESFFSIGDDDVPSSSSQPEPGFTNVSLNSSRIRRSSNSSIASDISFLPRYESATNLYHLQSDLDVSASEMEDNASSTSQLGHLSKEQIYAAFQKSQTRYHKYRGRYTDIANHYKELERENAKMKSVLVETQDKALRRVAELREQCSLEQKAKAHLENALRVELDEKQYVIDTLKTKVNLLQTGIKYEEPETLVKLGEENLEVLTKDLKDARMEIESLNEKLQEMKANSIIFTSKENDWKKKISDLEEVLKEKTVENSEVLERERENNLIIAQTKMELHTEIQNRDQIIANLKRDVESYESKPKSGKMENLQSQNMKLIEKVEELTQKCNNYESELLKTAQLRIEIENLTQIIESFKAKTQELEEEKIKMLNEKNLEVEDKLNEKQLEYDEKISAYRDDTKKHLLMLETKIKEKIQIEFDEKEKILTSNFHERLQEFSKNDNNLEQTQLKLVEKEDEIKNYVDKLEKTNAMLKKLTSKYNELEANHLDLITESSEVRNKQNHLEKENVDLMNTLDQLKNEKKSLKHDLNKLQAEHLNLQEQNANTSTLTDLNEKNAKLTEELNQLEAQNQNIQSEYSLLQCQLTNLQNSNEKLQKDKTTLENEISNLNVSVTELLDVKENYVKIVAANEALQSEIEEKLAANRNLQSSAKSMEETAKKQLKQEQSKFYNDIQTLNNEISSFKDKNAVIQSCIDEYKLKLNEYEVVTKEKSARLQELMNNNVMLKTENDRLINDLELSKKKVSELSVDNERLKIDVLEKQEQLSEREEESLKHSETAVSLKSQLEKFESEVKNVTEETEQLRIHVSSLQNDCESSREEKHRLVGDLEDMRVKLTDLTNENGKLQDDLVFRTRDQERICRELEEESREARARMLEEIAELNRRNSELSLDCTQTTKENEQLLQELADVRLKHETLTNEKTEFYRILTDHEADKARLLQELSECKNEISKHVEEKTKLGLDIVEQLENENKQLKLKTIRFDEHYEACEKVKKNLEVQYRELENQFTEISYEKQLLKDEIQELKISPINMVNNRQTNKNLDNLSILNNVEELDKSSESTNFSDVKKLQEDYKREINALNEKLVQYKSLDLTNQSSIHFYENELQKLKVKNEKLNRKLDETLVTLNHCAELSTSTETEYLRNVLYNYMLGKEGMVLARVIAAVCKFDDGQTEAILQREQQKQTLLGQLGFV